ncbi:hypothetical protein [Sorangium sp. So ce1389]|uniref:hypothetical protein n=1 Tax=Sorangium sp. So ce1389 TaxID=3133336 RepID=UPI003F605F98
MIADERPAGRVKAARTPAPWAAARRAPARPALGVLLAASTATAPAAPAPLRAEDMREPEPPVIEELFLGELAFPQEALELQIASSPAWRRHGRLVRFSVPLQLELGITDRLQIGGELPLELARNDRGVAAGLGVVRAEALYSFLDDRALGLTISAGVEAGLPAGSRELGATGHALEPFVSVHKSFGSVHLCLSASAEVTLPAAPSDAAEISPGVALAAVLPVGDLAPTVELAAELDDAASLLFAPGVRWHPARGLELGAALSLGLEDEAPDLGLLLLVTTEIQLADDDVPEHESGRRSP